ncbi:hypothetical protein E2320_002669 [Naja naja]|nr:hypothetical protein E2320_002669 [Naja naja]
MFNDYILYTFIYLKAVEVAKSVLLKGIKVYYLDHLHSYNEKLNLSKYAFASIFTSGGNPSAHCALKEEPEIWEKH